MNRCLLLVAASSLATLALLSESPQYRENNPEIYPPDCGRRPAVDGFSKIVGGQDARRGSWPWQVSLQSYVPYYGYQHSCSGVLLNYNTVLTAAHCIEFTNEPQRYRVAVGLHNLQKPDENQIQTSDVHEIIVHVNYSKKTFQDDIALMILEKKFEFTLYIQPICLSKPDQHLTEKYLCHISGWGKTTIKGTNSDILQEAKVQLISQRICNGEDWYAGLLQPNMMCAGYEAGGVGSCLGDDGGPLMCFYPDTARFYLVGITSFGHGCGERKSPTVYTWVPAYRRWMDAILVSHEDTPMNILQALNLWIIGWVTLHLVL